MGSAVSEGKVKPHPRVIVQAFTPKYPFLLP